MDSPWSLVPRPWRRLAQRTKDQGPGTWLALRRNVADFFHGMAFGGHEAHLRGRAADLNDLFMLMTCMEMFGLPNPAAYYLLDVYPLLVEEFHLWHRRMGFDRSPLATFSCC